MKWLSPLVLFFGADVCLPSGSVVPGPHSLRLGFHLSGVKPRQIWWYFFLVFSSNSNVHPSLRTSFPDHQKLPGGHCSSQIQMPSMWSGKRHGGIGHLCGSKFSWAGKALQGGMLAFSMSLRRKLGRREGGKLAKVLQ